VERFLGTFSGEGAVPAQAGITPQGEVFSFLFLAKGGWEQAPIVMLDFVIGGH
jgi:hypothetical protein